MLPPSTGIKTVVPDKSDIDFAQQQLSQNSETPSEMTPQMKSFMNQVAPQKQDAKRSRINEKRSNEVYSSQPVAIERTDLKSINEVLEKIPTFFGKKRPDFNQQDYIRMAIKNQLRKDLERIKKGKKIFYSRYSGLNS